MHITVIRFTKIFLKTLHSACFGPYWSIIREHIKLSKKQSLMILAHVELMEILPCRVNVWTEFLQLLHNKIEQCVGVRCKHTHPLLQFTV